MRLSDRDLKSAIADGSIKMTPQLDDKDIHSVSCDLSLGHEFRVFAGHHVQCIDLGGDSGSLKESLDRLMSEPIFIAQGERIIIHPGELILGVTHEHIQIDAAHVGWLDGRSSLARLGLMIHVTSHRIDPGWSGQVVLEFYNSGKIPLALAPGMKICAINFEKLSSPAERAYTERSCSKYKHQKGAVCSKISQD